MTWEKDKHYFPYFSTGLMRASSDDVYFPSIESILHKYRFYMLSLGDDTVESYWQIGTEFLTVYADNLGFRVLPNSKLENDLGNLISDRDWGLLYAKYMHSSLYSDIRWSGDLGALRKELIKTSVQKTFSDYVQKISEITSISVSIFRVHSEVEKVYLEKI